MVSVAIPCTPLPMHYAIHLFSPFSRVLHVPIAIILADVHSTGPNGNQGKQTTQVIQWYLKNQCNTSTKSHHS